jgi:hypothetical protein
VYFNAFSEGSVWFLIFLAIMTALLPDIVIKVIENLKIGNLGNNFILLNFIFELNLRLK